MPLRTPDQDLLQSVAKNHWKRIGACHHHGIAVPLFSLSSCSSFGIGEYPDLFPLIDWCKSVGMDVIQLLPLNDTGDDTSPYSAISAFALNPLHLGITKLTGKKSALPLCDTIDYQRVRSLKRAFLKRYLEDNKQSLTNDPQYILFCSQNPWLEEYGLFAVLCELHGTSDWTKWPKSDSIPTPKHYHYLLDKHRANIDSHLLIQFLCHRQLQEVRDYADERGIFLMGDIPILVNRGSCDVWRHTHLFNLNFSAGAPPDVYTEEGQNWGVPLFHWKAHEQEGFSWWRTRLQFAQNYFHIYRIDHAIGFFRLFAIPPNKTGKEGHFIPQDITLALEQGPHLLKMMLEATSMLPIAEDLGIIPNAVPAILRELGICGTKVMRWELHRDDHERVLKLEEYPPPSLTTVSTHDSEPLRLWWRDYPKEAEVFAKGHGLPYSKELKPEVLKQILHKSHHTSSFFHINPLQEYLELVPQIADSHLEATRINIPGTISNRNWSYRYKALVEEIQANPLLAKEIRDILF